MSKKTSSRKEAKGKPCEGSYYAQQIPGAVVIHAKGTHSTSGFEVKLVKSSLAIFPPEYFLEHKQPTGPVLQVITPFAVLATFKAQEAVGKVTVRDAKGRHEVPVEQARDLATVGKIHPISAAADWKSCTYQGKTYSHGSKVCQNKTVHICSNGIWMDSKKPCK